MRSITLLSLACGFPVVCHTHACRHTHTHTHTPLVETRTAGYREGSEEAAADRCGWPHTSPSGT